ncbi:MAG: BON domain-containing protein, partial [Ignavibacteriaceae bacterium]
LKDHFPLEKNVVADVNDGIVTVSGSVRNLWAKEHITDELLQIAGVNDVNNDLVILPPESK